MTACNLTATRLMLPPSKTHQNSKKANKPVVLATMSRFITPKIWKTPYNYDIKVFMLMCTHIHIFFFFWYFYPSQYTEGNKSVLRHCTFYFYNSSLFKGVFSYIQSKCLKLQAVQNPASTSFSLHIPKKILYFFIYSENFYFMAIIKHGLLAL